MKKECKHPPLEEKIGHRRFISRLVACVMLLAFSSPSLFAQERQTFTVDFKANTLGEVFDYFSRHSDYVFTFNSENIRQDATRVTHSFVNATLESILTTCLEGTDFTFEIVDRHVVIKKRPVVQQGSMTVRGFVYDEKKQPLPGVTVRVVGTSVGTATTDRGWFSIDLPLLKGQLEFSFVGYKSKTVNFTEETAADTLRVYMEESVEELDEAVVVAYGETTRRKSTGAISTVKAEEFRGIPSSSIANLLQGRVAGMDVSNLSGAPGGGDIAITIRGYNSLDVEQKRRFSNPLWVVDGVPLNSFTSPITGINLLADINPDMIESIQVLKDASSAAIYGSRAANGVIIVTTKKGRKNQDATFSVNFSQSWSILPRYPDLTIGRVERLLRLEQNRNDPSAYVDEETNRWKYPENLREQYDHTEGVLDANWIPDVTYAGTRNGNWLQDSLNPFYNNASNYFKMFFETGKITNANIQAYGGSDRMTYGIGLGYYDETGIYKGTGYHRIDLNSNINVTPVKRVNVDLRFNASITGKKRATANASENLVYSNSAVSIETIGGDAYRMSSLYPGEGSVVWESVLNTYEGTNEKNRSVRLRSSFRLGYDIIDGLNLSTSLSADYVIDRRNYFVPADMSYEGYSKSIGETAINLMVLSESLLTYKKTIKDDHQIDFVGGFSYQYDQEEYNGGYAQNSPSDKIYYAPNGMPDIGYEDWGGYEEAIAFKNYQSDMQEKCLISYFARLEYGYKGKYLLSASVRWDGSSTFGEDNRWGMFPSVAAAWNFSEETFIKDNAGWLSFGKFRASWGRSGMHFAQNYLALGQMTTDIPYMGNGLVRPDWYGGLYNRDLGWEETDQYDFGLDMDFFDYRLGITADYYYRLTNNLLDKVYLPSGAYQKYDSQWRNAKTISNEGLELLVRYEIFRRPDLYWKISVNGARNWNRFKSAENKKDDDTRIIGKPLNGIYLLKTDGYIDEQDEMPLYYNAVGVSNYLAEEYFESMYFRPGDYKFIDVDGDGTIDFDDRVYSGSALPEMSGGIVNEVQWKNFDLNMLISYQLGRYMTNYITKASMVGDPILAIIMDTREVSFWEKPGDNADLPILQSGVRFSWQTVSDDVEKVNWLKLKTLTVGYTLPKDLVKRWGLNELRFFASGENLFTWTNYSGIEPETVDIRTGSEVGGGSLPGDFPYPLARKFTLGLTIKF